MEHISTVTDRLHRTAQTLTAWAASLWSHLRTSTAPRRDPGPLDQRRRAPGPQAAVSLAPRPPLTQRLRPWRSWLIGGAIVFGASILWTLAQPTQGQAEVPPSHTLRAEIQPDGPALFYAVYDNRRYRIWSVNCRTPLRGCVARAPGLALRLDEQHRPWLIVPAALDARLSVQEGAQTRDLPHLMHRPLDPDAIDRLSRPKARLLIEEQGRVTAAIATEGMDEVLSYLAWLKSDKGRTLRDARLWPRTGILDPNQLTNPQLERLAAQQRYLEGNKAQHVPRTKPQIEFAIRAQDGASFFDGDGNWSR